MLSWPFNFRYGLILQWRQLFFTSISIQSSCLPWSYKTKTRLLLYYHHRPCWDRSSQTLYPAPRFSLNSIAENGHHGSGSASSQIWKRLERYSRRALDPFQVLWDASGCARMVCEGAAKRKKKSLRTLSSDLFLDQIHFFRIWSTMFQEGSSIVECQWWIPLRFWKAARWPMKNTFKLLY